MNKSKRKKTQVQYNSISVERWTRLSFINYKGRPKKYLSHRSHIWTIFYLVVTCFSNLAFELLIQPTTCPGNQCNLLCINVKTGAKIRIVLVDEGVSGDSLHRQLCVGYGILMPSHNTCLSVCTGSKSYGVSFN